MTPPVLPRSRGGARPPGATPAAITPPPPPSPVAPRSSPCRCSCVPMSTPAATATASIAVMRSGTEPPQPRAASGAAAAAPAAPRDIAGGGHVTHHVTDAPLMSPLASPGRRLAAACAVAACVAAALSAPRSPQRKLHIFNLMDKLPGARGACARGRPARCRPVTRLRARVFLRAFLRRRRPHLPVPARGLPQLRNRGVEAGVRGRGRVWLVQRLCRELGRVCVRAPAGPVCVDGPSQRSFAPRVANCFRLRCSLGGLFWSFGSDHEHILCVLCLLMRFLWTCCASIFCMCICILRSRGAGQAPRHRRPRPRARICLFSSPPRCGVRPVCDLLDAPDGDCVWCVRCTQCASSLLRV